MITFHISSSKQEGQRGYILMKTSPIWRSIARDDQSSPANQQTDIVKTSRDTRESGGLT